MKYQRIFLMGFMGSGKSTLGKALARSMGWCFVDMDHLFEERFQTTISRYFDEVGEDAFRKAERDILTELSTKTNVIVGTGGGAPCFFDNMEVMNHTGLTIYLKLSPQILFERLIHARQTRPLVAGKTEGELLSFIQDRLASREPFYNKAHLVVDAGRLSVEDYIQIIRSSEQFGKL